MKGLVLKDFYLLTRYCRNFLLVAFVFLVMYISNPDNTAAITMLCAVTGILPITLLSYDEREGWITYCQTLPYTKAQYVSAKYVMGLFVCLGSMVLLGLLVIFLPGGGRSIVVTFFLAALGIGLWENLRQQGRVFPAAGALLLCVLAAQPLQGDYGWLGAATVAAVYLAGTDRRRQLIALGGCLALHYLFVPLWSYWGPALALLPSGGWAAFLLEAEGRLPYFQDFYLPYSLLMTAFACLTLPLLARYDGRRGNGSRWFFYWFYPGHLIVLGGIQILMTL